MSLNIKKRLFAVASLISLKPVHKAQVKVFRTDLPGCTNSRRYRRGGEKIAADLFLQRDISITIL